ncbi:hypothetical protein LQZ19_14465 [Treponema primitia]|uniref:hypothetical protein n=1 Tax=Treponema primitia TaxID=88058 RepID=UPI00397EAF2B
MRVGVSLCSGQVLALTLVILLGACKHGSEEMPLIPPVTPPLSRSVIGYGVISSSYTHVQNEPAPESVSLGYLRRGSVAEILERRIITTRGAPEAWIRVNTTYRGWIKEADVQIYDNEAQAMTASESLSSGPELR